MLNGVPDLMSGNSESRHAVGVVHRFAQSENFGSGVVMIAEFAGNSFHLNVADVVIFENASCDVRSGHAGSGGVLTVLAKAAFRDG